MRISVKKISSFLRSMKFGLILLGILCLVSVIGSIVPQGREEAFYLSTYSPLWAQIIISFKFFDIYHSIGFFILFFALSVNLFLCSTVRLKSVINKIKTSTLAPTKEQLKNHIHTEKYCSLDNINDIFKQQGFRKIDSKKDNSVEIYFSTKNRVGYLGSWLIHIGILAIIVFYSYGQYTYIDTAVYGVPGSIQEVEGTDYMMNINNFNIVYREDGSVQQYITEGTLTDKGGNRLVSGEIYVNNPMRYNGYTFYQHSTGWASEINVSKAEENLGNQTVYDGTAYVNNQEYIAIVMHHFYPDFVATETGFASKSNDLNNPKILYSLFYGGQRVDMNVASPGEIVNWEEFSFKFTTPQPYTYLSVNKMNGKIGAMTGSVVLMLGLFLAFYMKPKKLIVEKNKNNLHLYGDYSISNENAFKQSYQNKKDISI